MPKKILKSKLTMDLPKVGANLNRIMTVPVVDCAVPYTPEPCVVTYVNEEHNWYQVEFLETGLTECYNLPMFDHSILAGVARNEVSVPCICVETGFVYPSEVACAKDMGLHNTGICAAITGRYSSYHGYHFKPLHL